ncbi:hypothetical protein ABVN80_21310 [Acinetobacter baumannii]
MITLPWHSSSVFGAASQKMWYQKVVGPGQSYCIPLQVKC